MNYTLHNYTLHQTIHELIPQINQKYKLKIKIVSELYIDGLGGIHHKDNSMYSVDNLDYYGDKQIRQILFGLRELLGKTSKKLFLPKSQAQALDDRWFRPTEKDGEYTGQSMFDTDPDKVLKELIEILKELLK
jgi:hypothetical protein